MKPPASMASADYHKLLDQCIHCGLCLPACPTYQVLQTEMDNPRGRIQLMEAAADGRIALTGSFQEHIDLCLGCRACETACPSGVQFGSLLETARSAMVEGEADSDPTEAASTFALGQILANRDLLRFGATMLRLYQRSGLQSLMRKSGLLGKRLGALDTLLPRMPNRYPAYRDPVKAIGECRGKVAFLHGCIQDAFLSGVNEATVRVLRENGYDVHFPATQTCCGAAVLHNGDREVARNLARQNLDALDPNQFIAVISNAGGCGAMLKEYDHLLADDSHYAEKARQFSECVQDICEFLADHLHVPPRGTIARSVVYADSCHLRHAQKVIAQPRRLLEAIPGVDLVELADPGFCCGSAGVYNLTHPETAESILDLKMADVRATRADILVTTNTGCHMQYLHGMQKAGLSMQVMHLVELLDASYGLEAGNAVVER